MNTDNKKTAIIIGATGLVGSNLVEILLDDNHFDKINIFVRRSTGIVNPKLHEYVVDFATPETWRDKVQGDVLFSAMGTTLAKAGSKEKQYEIDYTYQYNTAVTAVANGVKDYVLISSMNAKASSLFFYPRIKGELEQAVSKLPFDTISILQPGLLYGDRDEIRNTELRALKIITYLNKMGMLKSQKPIHGKEVAYAMLEAHRSAKLITYYKGLELFRLAAQYASTSILQ